MKTLYLCCALVVMTTSRALAHDPICVGSYTVEKPSASARITLFGWDANDNTYRLKILRTNASAIGEFTEVLKAYGAPSGYGGHEFAKKAPVITIALDRKNGFYDLTLTNGKHLYEANIVDLSDGDDLCPIAAHSRAQ